MKKKQEVKWWDSFVYGSIIGIFAGIAIAWLVLIYNL